MIQVSDQAHLESLPDGSIIRWIRIPGDLTSEAIAFIRVEVETFSMPTVSDFVPKTQRTVWISPGGWTPMRIEEAGITYPVEVVRIGEFKASDYPTPTEGEWPQLDPPSFWSCEAQAQTLISGGTWGREKALEAATRLFAGEGMEMTGDIIGIMLEFASEFEEWLNRPEPIEADPTHAVLADLAGDDWGDEGPPPGYTPEGFNASPMTDDDLATLRRNLAGEPGKAPDGPPR